MMPVVSSGIGLDREGGGSSCTASQMVGGFAVGGFLALPQLWEPSEVGTRDDDDTSVGRVKTRWLSPSHWFSMTAV